MSTREQVRRARRQRHIFEGLTLLILAGLLLALIAETRAEEVVESEVSHDSVERVSVRRPLICEVDETTATAVIIPAALNYERPWNTIENARITAYCPCRKCCGKDPGHPAYGITSSGTAATQGRTVAVDTSTIPYGAEVEIDGRVYRAEDTGSGINGTCIDLYFDSHQDALQWGVQYMTVKWRATE